MPHGVRLIVNIDLSIYPFFSGQIENFSLLPIQGFCNENYSFRMAGQTYLLRKFKAQNIDRHFEFTVENLAYEKGIAAKPILLDDENSLMICEFLEGHHKNVLEEDDLLKLAYLLQQLHSIQISAEVIKLEEKLPTHSAEIKEAFHIISHHQVENVLCHNDLNPKNILFSEGVKLIDWEYAALNDRYFDLAAVCVEFKLAPKDEHVFLQNYFGSKEIVHLEKLNAYKIIYSALCKQWFDEFSVK